MHTSFAFASPFRQAIRRLVRERGFSVTVLITLALCIGANVAIFAVVDAVLVRSLPFPEPDRLVAVYNSYPGAGVNRAGASLFNYYDRRNGGLEAFASAAIVQGGAAIIGEAGSPTRVKRDRVSPEFFDTIGVKLLMGRSFTDEELDYSRSGVAVLTHGFWRSNFGGDPDVLGKTFQVDGLPVTVVGVLPADFRYLSQRPQFYVPAASDPKDRSAENQHSNNFEMIARLAPGATLASAQARMDARNTALVEGDRYAELVKGVGFTTRVKSLHADHVESIRPMLLLLQGGVLSLLLIGGVNLANLLLIRASGRAKELAVRRALGATGAHVTREVVIETTLLALAGGVLGLGVGALGIRLLDVLGADSLPLGATVALDARVAGFALIASLVTGLGLALPIVWFSLHRDLAPVLHAESRSGTVGRAAQRLRHVFIVAQVALAFVLLAGAGMLSMSLRHVLATPPGFQPESVLTGRISMPWKQYPEPPPRLAFIERLLTELRALPGVTHAAIISNLPFSGNNSNNAIGVEGIEPSPGDPVRAHLTTGTAGDYWQAMNIPLIEGRFLEEADNHREQKVCVVDEAFARRYWPRDTALGRRISNDPTFEEGDSYTIVGVVGTVKHNELSEEPMGAVYYPYREYSSRDVSVLVRTALAPEAIGPTLAKLVLQLDPEMPVDDLKPMQDRIGESLVSRRSPAILAGIFAGVALLLAGVGTYGVLAYAVAQRRREIGVRMALGALPGQVLKQFLGLGGRLLAAGTIIGLVFAWLAGRAMQSVLFGMNALDPGVLVTTAVALSIAVLLATFLPSRRASRVSPMVALRDE